MNRMVPFRYLFRAKLSRSSFSTQFRKLSMSHYHSSEKKDPIDGEKIVNEKPSKPNQKEGNEKLLLLIKSMKVSTSTALDKTQLARPKERSFRKRSVPKVMTEETEEITETERIATAAKEVAKSFGGNVKQTEIHLLSKVAAQSGPKKKVGSSTSSSSSSSSSSSDDEASLPKKELNVPVGPSLEPVIPKPKITKSHQSKKFNLSELIVGMTIDRKKPAVKGQKLKVQKPFERQSTGENQQWKERDRNNKGKRQERGIRNDETEYKRRSMHVDFNRPALEVKLFGGSRLNIFDVNKPLETKVDQLATWQTLKEREVQLSATHPPGNHFEELIQWTEQGKIWKFPIDNEQGLEEERSVSFADHVFLESHLEPWCPRKGPVRHFMELVCVGLSKNPHLTAGEKRSHIEWFRDYFDAKREILLETGALVEEGGTAGEHRAIA